jgi:hypothetical protein
VSAERLKQTKCTSTTPLEKKKKKKSKKKSKKKKKNRFDENAPFAPPKHKNRLFQRTLCIEVGRQQETS